MAHRSCPAGPSITSGRANPIAPHSIKEMKRQYSIKTGACIRLLAVPLMIAGMFLNSVCAVAEGPIPFNAMMLSSSAQAALPQQPDEINAPGTNTTANKNTNSGKAERITGRVLLGTGVAAIALTIVFTAAVGSKGHAGRVWAGIGLGAAMTGTGVYLIELGSDRRSAK